MHGTCGHGGGKENEGRSATKSPLIHGFLHRPAAAHGRALSGSIVERTRVELVFGSFPSLSYRLAISTRRVSLPPPISTNIGDFISMLVSATPAAFSASRTLAARLLAS
jgi:hypothetical protein